MEEILTIRLSKAEKERLKEMANNEGITLSELVIKSLKLKRRKRVKPRQELVNQAA
jgi:predicted HicB family RNase H-like nuclease